MYPHDLRDEIRRDVAALGRMLVVLDDDPTGTQTVHSVPVLADWSVDTLAREVRKSVSFLKLKLKLKLNKYCIERSTRL